MTDQSNEQVEQESEAQDNKADIRAVIIMFSAAVILAVHVVSGFSFDF